ncbi:SUMF1/EgtB/PvdO family nonheme iron enzyme [Thiorhodococcus fuscus]|uniref:SUMF1/EgtB/PvdO family nonheme iron enzyme n=1 Tax=Thiorhodococcus fuscus TaxID=527200 RepID=A0ABW4Y828_9GAMM
MDRTSHCPDCFQSPAPDPVCAHCGFDSSAYVHDASLLAPFTRLGGGLYLVGRVLGRPGGFGVVYAGWQARIGKPVAIKEFFPSTFNPLARRNGQDSLSVFPLDPDAFERWKARFLEEARLLAQLDHPGIVQAHDVLEENKTAYLVMERLGGQTLADTLGGLRQTGTGLVLERRLPAAQALPLLLSALDGLAYLHRQPEPKGPILHLDLTPNNLVLQRDPISNAPDPGRIKLLDFGLARTGERIAGNASIGAGVGHPNFMPPEQADRQRQQPVTPAADAYTLGATLYTALTAVAPPAAEARRAGAPLADLTARVPELDPGVARVLMDCLHLAADQRPRDALDLQARLAALTQLPPPPPPAPTATQHPVSTHDTYETPSPSAASPSAVDASDGEPERPQHGTRGRKKGLLALILMGAIIAGGWSLWAAMFPASDEEPHPIPVTPIPKPPVKPQGELIVRSNVSGDTWYLDGRRIGPTSPEPYEAAAGTHSIRIEKPGFFHYEAQVDLTPGELRTVRAELTPAPEMIEIQGGCFQMGSSADETERLEDERQHQVCVQDFLLGRHEVTVDEFRRFVEATGYHTDAERNAGDLEGCFADYDQEKRWTSWRARADANWHTLNPDQYDQHLHPVACVSWYDAQAYIAWLNAQGKGRYRLPTEAEWEYAARAGTRGARYWGDAVDARACQYANIADKAHGWKLGFPCDDGYEWSAPVGSFRANPWGLEDMLGNVWEWTCSVYDKRYGGAESRCADETNPGRRSLRGSSWFNAAPNWVRSALRGSNKPGYRYADIGFRLARDPR